MSLTDDPLPDLIRTLRNPSADARARAARALGRLGWLAREALPLLVNALSDTDPAVRENAAQAVGQMGPEALPHITGMLSHEDKYVRRNAVWALGKLGPLARGVWSELCTTLRDPDPRTASGAAQALGNMGADAVEAIPALTEAMRGTNIVLCRLASKALSQIGRPALSSLIAHLRHRDPFVRGEAALALGWMGPAATAAVPSLIDALRPPRTTAALRAGPVSVATRTPTTSILNTPPPASPSTDDNSRACAAQALGRIGQAASGAIEALTLAAHDPNEQVRQSALQAIRQIQTT
ncbi:HEAT repeat domain-containing protein [Fimbriiglobus ruber]|nr:HEAT repeat domain-containing protein [Fimbriiglobus ruber]